jgi:hypothetical protein
MFGRDRFFLSLALLTAATVGCGSSGDTMGSGGQGGTTASSTTSSSTTTTSSSSTSGSGTGTGGTTSFAEHPPVVNLCTNTTVVAVDKLIFGEGDNGEWKQYGFDIDGLMTSTPSTVCQPADGGMPNGVYPRGDNGINNAFGAIILPLILSVDTTWPTDVNNAIQAGTFTVLLEMDCLPETGNASAFTTKLFGGTMLGMTPKWDGTDKWPVEPDLLSNPMDPESSTITFPACSVTGSAFDSGKNVTVVLTVPVATGMMSTSLKLTLYAAQMTMNLSADRKSATGGMLGGVLNTQELMAQVEKIGALLQLCDNSILPTLLTDIQEASDILSDGTQDPTKTCDGISMGIGFTMAPAQIGSVGPAAPVGSSCSP